MDSIPVPAGIADRFPHCHRVNDLHSGLNPASVLRTFHPRNLFELAATVDRARRLGVPVSVCGGRHAMGGQQFADGGWLIDLSGCNRVLQFDAQCGLVEVEAGMRWPELLQALDRLQPAQAGVAPWTFRQKQTGADQLSIGGALSANIHGRGLDFAPFVSDIESFTLVTADGRLRRASRTEHADLFRLAIGGYGLFGIVGSVTLRLVRRQRLRREVEVVDVDHLMDAFDARRAQGFLYGDWQFAIDPAQPGFLTRGVFSCYRPVDDADACADAPADAPRRELSESDWKRLLLLAHVDKARAFDEYAAFYLSTSGQCYDSDAHQMSRYVDGYHREIDWHLGCRGSEMITELYVPRARLADFMRACAFEFRAHGTDVVYGTVRLIRRDDETFLAWARQDYACVIFNLHVGHTPAGIDTAAAAFCRLIDRAAERGGSYYLTYHRFATRAQVEACHPRFRAFLRLKAAWDPDGLFQSDWYRHCRDLFAGGR
ncbi:MAG: FAD-binding oxidoreductase [bacterium]|jgi:FAD/FMN-containing dehydrogenase|nr:FAD-binding oxidoreductase [Betaproteobacteria bacterium]